MKVATQPDVVLDATMTTPAGSSVTVRDDLHLFNTAEVDVGMVGDVSRTGSASMRSTGEHRAPDTTSGRHIAAFRRRSFAAMSPDHRLSSSPPTIEDIEVEIFDDDDDELEERNANVRLLSKNIEEILHGEDLYLEEPLQLPSTTKDDCWPLEEDDCVTTLQSFSPAEDCRRRRRLTSASRYSPLYRCYSTHVDPWSPSRLVSQSTNVDPWSPSVLGRQAPRQRRISWCSFDDKLVVHPAVERCLQRDHVPPDAEDVGTESTKDEMRQEDSRPNHEVEEPASRDEAPANTATVNVNLRDHLQAMFQVADNRLAMKLFGSHNALLKEKQRQKAVGIFVIHPCSSFRYHAYSCTRFHRLPV